MTSLELEQQTSSSNGQSLKVRFAVQKQLYGRKIFVDLINVYKVSQLLIYFSQNIKCESNLKVQVWSVQKDSRSKVGYLTTLVHSQQYSNATYSQVSVFAHNHEQMGSVFKPTQQCEALGLSGLNAIARYFIIYIS